MRGSILVTFDELVDDRGIDSFAVFINGILRDSHWTDINNYYSTYCFPGDVVEIQILYQGSIPNLTSLIRRDYTTDDEGGDNGIKETSITPTITNPTPTIYNIIFTATTRNDAYNFHYVIDVQTIPCYSIGSGFGGDSVGDMVLQSDGKLLLTTTTTGQTFNGTSIGTMVRLNTDGSLDNTFNVSPILYSDIWEGFALQSTGKIVAGTGFGLNRLNSDGSTDNTFYSAATNNTVFVTKILSDDKIIVAGAFTTYSGQSYNRIIKLNSDGTIDNTFIIGSGFTGATNPFVNDIDIQSDGKIIVGGNFTSYSGQSRNGLVRLNTDGSLDNTFNIGTGFFGGVNDVNILSDGKILVGGTFTSYNGTLVNDIVRLNSDGSYDSTFISGTGFAGGGPFGAGSIFAMAIQPDDKSLVGGYFTSYDGQTNNRIIRLNTDGSIDTSFNSGTGFLTTPTDTTTAVFDIVLTPTLEIYVCGRFNRYNGKVVGNFIKLTNNGTSLIC